MDIMTIFLRLQLVYRFMHFLPLQRFKILEIMHSLDFSWQLLASRSFHRFEKQLPYLVHAFSQFGDIFGIYAVGAVDSLANLIDVDPDFVDLGCKFSLL